jgi:hypothetical protein
MSTTEAAAKNAYRREMTAEERKKYLDGLLKAYPLIEVNGAYRFGRDGLSIPLAAIPDWAAWQGTFGSAPMKQMRNIRVGTTTYLGCWPTQFDGDPNNGYVTVHCEAIMPPEGVNVPIDPDPQSAQVPVRARKPHIPLHLTTELPDAEIGPNAPVWRKVAEKAFEALHASIFTHMQNFAPRWEKQSAEIKLAWIKAVQAAYVETEATTRLL